MDGRPTACHDNEIDLPAAAVLYGTVGRPPVTYVFSMNHALSALLEIVNV